LTDEKTNVSNQNSSVKDREYWKNYNARPERKEYNRKIKIKARDDQDGVNNNSLETRGLAVDIKDFEEAESLIKWLENCQKESGKFPRAWLKKERLALASDGFWKAFTELLKTNHI
jgi:hypothetical protein